MRNPRNKRPVRVVRKSFRIWVLIVIIVVASMFGSNAEPFWRLLLVTLSS